MALRSRENEGEDEDIITLSINNEEVVELGRMPEKVVPIDPDTDVDTVMVVEREEEEGESEVVCLRDVKMGRKRIVVGQVENLVVLRQEKISLTNEIIIVKTKKHQEDLDEFLPSRVKRKREEKEMDHEEKELKKRKEAREEEREVRQVRELEDEREGGMGGNKSGENREAPMVDPQSPNPGEKEKNTVREGMEEEELEKGEEMREKEDETREKEEETRERDREGG